MKAIAAAGRHLLESLRVLEKVGDAPTEVGCLIYLIVLYRRKHDLPAMNQYLPRLLKFAAEAQMREYSATGQANTAWHTEGKGAQ